MSISSTTTTTPTTTVSTTTVQPFNATVFCAQQVVQAGNYPYTSGCVNYIKCYPYNGTLLGAVYSCLGTTFFDPALRTCTDKYSCWKWRNWEQATRDLNSEENFINFIFFYFLWWTGIDFENLQSFFSSYKIDNKQVHLIELRNFDVLKRGLLP